tara:strand:+ start:323 stop:520 length:198 start_codon:yes stop_codon:yes gene_type:complete
LGTTDFWHPGYTGSYVPLGWDLRRWEWLDAQWYWITPTEHGIERNPVCIAALTEAGSNTGSERHF